MSSRLYSLLLHHGPYKNKHINSEELFSIGELFRHIIDFKSSFTATHTARVSACAEIMSKLFGLTELEVSMMRIAGNFHDLGKLMIPNSILEKPGRLSKDEFNIIKSHTYYTYRILKSIGGLERITDWAAFHHEKLNGEGYPFHLDYSKLDIGSRIMAVSDIFVALREDRPIEKSWKKKKFMRS
jgi:HD-GYP domain-containing protein (c-di-GMP phosphodiesterase class II)